jgi:class 3 adenylate cyclase
VPPRKRAEPSRRINAEESAGPAESRAPRGDVSAQDAEALESFQEDGSESGKPEATRLPAALDLHAPTGTTVPDWLLSAIAEGEPVQMVVLAADIRRSTFLMKEAANLPHFAQTLGNFVGASRRFIRERGGWWDKFTGDGFLAYWPFQEDDTAFEEAVDFVLRASSAILRTFETIAVDEFRRNSRNFPGGIGLSFGVDAGPVHIVEVAGDLTIVGPTVVGAVRMVSAAYEPSELMANVYVGEYLFRQRDRDVKLIKDVERCQRPTKEFDQQEVYRIVFERRTADEEVRRSARRQRQESPNQDVIE